MKRLIWGPPTLLLLSAFVPSVFANSIPTFNITGSYMPFIPDNGSGDNELYFLDGPSASVSGSGTARCDWCFVGTILLPARR
jgi:hypothetical protein